MKKELMNGLAIMGSPHGKGNDLFLSRSRAGFRGVILATFQILISGEWVDAKIEVDKVPFALLTRGLPPVV